VSELELHFYASMTTIADIQSGREMFVHTKEGRTINENVHMSVDTKYYNVKQFSNHEPSLFKVQRKRGS